MIGPSQIGGAGKLHPVGFKSAGTTISFRSDVNFVHEDSRNAASLFRRRVI
jgi:hypothetical protein